MTPYERAREERKMRARVMAVTAYPPFGIADERLDEYLSYVLQEQYGYVRTMRSLTN